jgi:hypothetical protein
MKLESYLDDDDTDSTEVETLRFNKKGRPAALEVNEDLESLVDKYQQELSCTLESIKLETEQTFQEEEDDDDEDDDDCLVEIERLSMSMKTDSFHYADRDHSASSRDVETSPRECNQDATTIADNVNDLEKNYEQLLQKWQDCLQKRDTIGLHHSIMQEVCENVDISPFQASRLSELSCYEYQSMIFQGTCRRLHNDYRVLINWMYAQIETQEKDQERETIEYQRCIEQATLKLVESRQQKVKELQDTLLERKQVLLSALERLKTQN